MYLGWFQWWLEMTRNGAGLDQSWGLQMRGCGQMSVGKSDGGQSRNSVLTMLNLRWLLNI